MSYETRKALGARIRNLRKEDGLSQQKLALMVDVERSYLAKLEAGKRNPSIDVVEKLADGLNVTLSELFDGIEKEAATIARNAAGAEKQSSYFHIKL